MRINNNLMAMNTHRQLGSSNAMGAKSMERLSSGFRINRAGDDAAGLAISEKMRAQIRGLNQASRNAQDGISLIQTAEGSLGETQSILQRMRELAVQAASDTNVDADRGEIQKEMHQLTAEVNRISTTTEFNTKKLLDTGGASITLQVGANTGQSFDISIAAMGATDLDISAANASHTISVATGETARFAEEGGSIALNILNHDNATAAISVINSAIETVSSERSKLGAFQNRLESTIRNLDSSAENIQASESRIRDVDMAKEMMEFTKQNILQQAATAMLAQANQAPQGVLQLLR